MMRVSGDKLAPDGTVLNGFPRRSVSPRSRILGIVVAVMLGLSSGLAAESVEEVRAQLIQGGQWRTHVYRTADAELPDSLVWQFTPTRILGRLTEYVMTRTGEIKVLRVITKPLPYTLRRATSVEEAWSENIMLCIPTTARTWATTGRAAACLPVELTGPHLFKWGDWYFHAEGFLWGEPVSPP